jgi:nitrogen fixation protein NifB
MNDQEKMLQYLSNHHPCFAGKSGTNAARIHIPVCPACNIRCNYCQRSINAEEDRPGVAESIMQPAEALKAVKRGLMVCPELQVVGIAGPGDSLVGDAALQSFRLIREQYPDLLFCLSTNGLLLAEKAEQLQELGVKTVTVTVNAVEPEILSRICSEVVFAGQRYQGTAAGELLISQQQKGIRKAAELGIVVKVNIVLVPGVNDEHIEQIAVTVKEWGANIINIIPLIPQYKMADIPEPNCADLQKAREQTERHISLFRHCQRCRADAVGIPGKSEYRQKVYEKEPEKTNFSHG